MNRWRLLAAHLVVATTQAEAAKKVKAFLDRDGQSESSYFHLCDEAGEGQHISNDCWARQILRDLAPRMKVMDALSDIEHGPAGRNAGIRTADGRADFL